MRRELNSKFTLDSFGGGVGYLAWYKAHVLNKVSRLRLSAYPSF
jgi:hypothetical protein